MNKEEVLQQVKKWHEQDAFTAIIELLEPQITELDFTVGLELARAYINLANTLNEGNNPVNTLGEVQSADDLYAQANALLDKYVLEGKENATYLFYKGYALFKLGLINDAALRLERAQRFIKMGSEDALLPTINRMLTLCKSLDADNTSDKLSPEDDSTLDQHIRQHFGKYQILFKTERYELLNVPPTPERNFNLIVTKGLSGHKLKVPAGVDPLTDSRLELILCLPAAWEFANAEGYNLWPINQLRTLINHILTTDEFIGFGYSFDQERPLHASTKFTGGMLTAPGAFPCPAHEVVLGDNSYVHFFELIYLYPMELSFRKSHSAYELLELFQHKQVVPSPVRSRQDVCVQVSSAQKI